MRATIVVPEHFRLPSVAVLVAAMAFAAGCAAPGNETNGDGRSTVHTACDFEYPDGTPVACDANNTVEERLASGELPWGCIRHEPDFFVLHIDRLNGRAILELTLAEEGGNWVVFTMQQRATPESEANTTSIAFRTDVGTERVPVGVMPEGELRIVADAYALNVSDGQPLDWRPLWSVYLANGSDEHDVPMNWLIVEAALDGNRTVYVDPMVETEARAPREGTFHAPRSVNVTFAGVDVRLEVETLASYAEVVWDVAAETHGSCRPA